MTAQEAKEKTAIANANGLPIPPETLEQKQLKTIYEYIQKSAEAGHDKLDYLDIELYDENVKTLTENGFKIEPYYGKDGNKPQKMWDIIRW